MIERIDEPAADDEHADSAEPDDRIRQSADVLDGLGLPSDSGAPRAREMLRDAGHRFGNDVISAAVRMRKQLSGTAQS